MPRIRKARNLEQVGGLETDKPTSQPATRRRRNCDDERRKPSIARSTPRTDDPGNRAYGGKGSTWRRNETEEGKRTNHKEDRDRSTERSLEVDVLTRGSHSNRRAGRHQRQGGSSRRRAGRRCGSGSSPCTETTRARTQDETNLQAASGTKPWQVVLRRREARGREVGEGTLEGKRVKRG